MLQLPLLIWDGIDNPSSVEKLGNVLENLQLHLRSKRPVSEVSERRERANPSSRLDGRGSEAMEKCMYQQAVQQKEGENDAH